MTEQELDFWHDQGKVPDWWYYQKSTKPLWMKWQEQEDKFKAEIAELEQQKKLQHEIEIQLEDAVEKALENLLEDFQ